MVPYKRFVAVQLLHPSLFSVDTVSLCSLMTLRITELLNHPSSMLCGAQLCSLMGTLPTDFDLAWSSQQNPDRSELWS